MKKRKYLGSLIGEIMETAKKEISVKEDSIDSIPSEKIQELWNKKKNSIIPFQISLFIDDIPISDVKCTLTKGDEKIGTGNTDNNGLVIWDNPEILVTLLEKDSLYTLHYLLDNKENTIDIQYPEDSTYVNVTIDNGKVVIDTDGTVEDDDPYKLSPAGTIDNWDYTLDEANKIVTLNYYIGSEIDVIVYANYIINGEIYKTQLADKTNDMFNGLTRSNCNNIESIIFSKNIDTSNVTAMHKMFYYCQSLTSIDISGFDTSKVLSMNGMFNSCKSLKSLDLSSFDTSNVANMNGMFYQCLSLESLDLSSFDTSNAYKMSYMFYGCTKLEEIIASRDKWIISSGCDITGMFYNCRCSEVTYVG